MMKPVVLLALLSLACVQPFAQELLVVGEVVSSRAISVRTPECPSKSGSFTQPNGSVKIVIDNACGCEVVEVAVQETLIGNAPGPTAIFKPSIGEWCRLNVTRLRTPVLAYSNGRATALSFPVDEKDDQVFKRGQIPSLLGLPAPGSAKDSISLDTLRAELKAARKQESP